MFYLAVLFIRFAYGTYLFVINARYQSTTNSPTGLIERYTNRAGETRVISSNTDVFRPPHVRECVPRFWSTVALANPYDFFRPNVRYRRAIECITDTRLCLRSILWLGINAKTRKGQQRKNKGGKLEYTTY